MTGNKPDPSLRSPMQWDDTANAGFSSGVPWSMIKLDSKVKNVQVQSADPDSLLNHYRSLIRVRSSHSALRSGGYIPVKANASGLFAMLRTADKETVLVLVNLTGEVISNPTLTWDKSTLEGTLKPILLLGKGKPAAFTTAERGSVKDYIPLPEIGPGETILLQILP